VRHYAGGRKWEAKGRNRRGEAKGGRHRAKGRMWTAEA